MNKHYMTNLSVIAFLVLAIASGFILASIANQGFGTNAYQLKAYFQNSNGLYIGAPVKIGGITVGNVSDISLDLETYGANVIIGIKSEQLKIPKDSVLSITSESLVGYKFAQIQPGLSETYLKDGQTIDKTTPGVIIDEIIAKLIAAYAN
ncbi:MAG: MlaD family protein [Pseudomonadota bacterium]|nr:MlaD family protein [Pseudomonadota bacterium]